MNEENILSNNYSLTNNSLSESKVFAEQFKNINAGFPKVRAPSMGAVKKKGQIIPNYSAWRSEILTWVRVVRNYVFIFPSPCSSRGYAYEIKNEEKMTQRWQYFGLLFLRYTCTYIDFLREVLRNE